MSLTKFLHNPMYIGKVASYSFKDGQRFFGDLALEYLGTHNDYYTLIENNLAYFGLSSDADAVKKVVENIGFHYHEKFLSFNKDPSFYPEFHQKIVKDTQIIEEIRQNQKEKQATIILSTHFGAMALIPGVLNSCKLDISSIIKFPSEEFRNLIMSKHKTIVETLGYGHTQFFEVDKQPIMELAFGLKDGETFFSVLDEHTPFSVDVTFLKKSIFGGAGIDKIIDFIGKENIKLYLTVMVRLENNYKLDLHRIDLTSENYVQDMFNIYETYVQSNFEQWFFVQEVHENMPEHS